MMKRLLMLIFLGIFLFGGWQAVLAQTGADITIGETVRGTKADAPITHTFNATAGQLLLINLISEDFDPRVTLTDGNGGEIASDDDSGTDYNSYLAFPVPSDGDYRLIVDSWSSGSGKYILTVEETNANTVAIGDTITLTAGGTPNLLATFDGTAGQVVNVYAVSPSEEDTRIRLVGANATVIAEDDDSGTGSNPYLRRVVLPDDGLYLVEVSRVFEDVISDNVLVTVEPTEALVLNDTPYEFVISDDTLQVEKFTLNAIDGVTYRIHVEMEGNGGIQLIIHSPDEAFDAQLTVNYGAVSWDYEAGSTGRFILETRPDLFSSGDTYRIWVQTLE